MPSATGCVVDFVRRQSELLAEFDYSRVLTADELRQRVRAGRSSGCARGQRSDRAGAGHQCNFEWLLLRLSLDLGPSLVCVYKQMKSSWAETLLRRDTLEIRRRPAALDPDPAAVALDPRCARVRARGRPGATDQPGTALDPFPAPGHGVFHGTGTNGPVAAGPTVYLSMRRSGRGPVRSGHRAADSGGRAAADGQTTERYARVLERDINADPAGWWWSHKRWKLRLG